MFFRYPVSVIYPALDYEMVKLLFFPNRIQQQPGTILFVLFSLIMNITAKSAFTVLCKEGALHSKQLNYISSVLAIFKTVELLFV